MEDKADTVMLLCPECRSFVPVSAYKGEMKGKTYSLDQAPLILIAEINEESKSERIQCMSCGMTIYLVVKFIAVERQFSVHKRFDIDFRMV